MAGEGELRLRNDGRSAGAGSPVTLMFGNATSALRLLDVGCGLLCGGGGRDEENAAGSGGSINPGGGVESNKSLSIIICAAGAFICKSRRGTLGV